ncbi:hypothetical protein H8E52_02800 [bacterium]|nr:hypothetical protein [bacterium]
MRNSMMIIALFGLLTFAGLWGCTEEHSPFEIVTFPAPLLDVSITAAEVLELNWEWSDEETDWYMIYLGGFTVDEFNNVVPVDTLIDSTETSPRSLLVPGLTEFDEELGDTLYRFMYFRVAPKTSGVEGLRSPAAFPHR